MIKKTLKITIFFTFVLFLFSSCARKVEDCKFLPGVELESREKSESQENKDNTEEKIRDLIKNGKPKAEISCNF